MDQKLQNWRDLSDNPNDPVVRAFLRETLLNARRGRIESTNDFIRRFVQDSDVLDIGIVGHTIERTYDSDWRHNIIRTAATRTVGIDILEGPVKELQARGYDVRLIDATSDVDLGERFSRIVLGDIIEHVDNAVSLLRFAARHLKHDGRLLCSTPNPFFIYNIASSWRNGLFIANAEHVSWITPTMALELAWRANLKLHGYWHTQGKGRTIFRKLMVRAAGLANQLDNELFSGCFYYEFEHPDGHEMGDRKDIGQ